MAPNRLSKEQSPYLLQHQDNPVDWYAWNDAAFQAARQQNKPIFLSIGYSTCYWCHMMEKDSFEIPEVGAALVKDFIAIKVDREEHPDVDQIYMDAVMGLTGRGGWPLTVFLTPDLKPFFGGTFFWRPQFLQILEQIAKIWREDPKRIVETATKITEHLQNDSPKLQSEVQQGESLQSAFTAFGKAFDSVHGGFGAAPKFPQATQLALLLRLYHRSQNHFALQMAEKTLHEMAHGGLYDHVGGGFHRYSTDERWFLPHFEKMLYDNALLVLAYADAWQITKKPIYADVVRETLDFVLRDMTHPEGGFFAALDAGDAGQEGDDYVWTHEQLRGLVPESDFSAFAETFGVTPEGNWEDQKNVLHLPRGQTWDARMRWKNVLKNILTERCKRPKPRLDSKVLTAWNGLMIAAMARGSQILGDPIYLQAAQRAARFALTALQRPGSNPGLLRSFCNGVAHLPGTLDDYAFFIFGLLQLQAVDLNSNWIQIARDLQAQQDEWFWDEENGAYFFSLSAQKDLIVRKKDFFDGALPSGNSLSALNLQKLYAFTKESQYQSRADVLLQFFASLTKRAPIGCTQALIACDYRLSRPKDVAVVVPAAKMLPQDFASLLQNEFLPYAVFEVTPETAAKPPLSESVTYFVCEAGACQKPTSDLNALQKMLSEREPLDLTEVSGH